MAGIDRKREAWDFSEATSYSIGDFVLYDGVLYKFIANHSAGSWDLDDVTYYDNNQESMINRIQNDKDIANDAIAFVESVSFTASAIIGTRYRLTLLT